MWKGFLVAVVMLLTACQSAAPTETILPTAPPTESPWLETVMNGVTLGLWRPDGWETDQSNGLVLAEHSVSQNGTVAGGMLIYCFVPAPDEYEVGGGERDDNYAWAVLDQVVQKSSSAGWDVTMTQPTAFEWDQQRAAYYLFTTGDGVRALVLALSLPNVQRVVFCTISVPAAQADRIRAQIPQLMDGLTINGTKLDGTALDALPDPLPFPRYSFAPSHNSEHTASGSPP